MTSDFLPFSKPSISQEAIDEVVSCLQSGWITSGPRLAKFEAALKKYFNRDYVIPLSSATAGLHFALLALNLKPGDEVITTPLTFVATLNTIVHAGAKPVLVDVEPHTLNIDVNKIEDAITERTRVILPVHFAGLPVDLEPLYAIANNNNIRVIEDCAHAIGTEYKNQLIGSFGDIQVFSFHPNKNMTTGEGGCVVTNDEKLAKRISRLLFHGIEREPGAQEYDVMEAGFKANMMDIQAALGLHQLPQLDTFIDKRTQLANRYREFLADWNEFTLPELPGFDHKHAWHLMTVLVDDRKAFMDKMKSLNIGTGLHYQAIHLHTFYRERFNFNPGDFPIAESIADRIVSLPLFPDMSLSDQDRVFNALNKIYRD